MCTVYLNYNGRDNDSDLSMHSLVISQSRSYLDGEKVGAHPIEQSPGTIKRTLQNK